MISFPFYVSLTWIIIFRSTRYLCNLLFVFMQPKSIVVVTQYKKIIIWWMKLCSRFLIANTQRIIIIKVDKWLSTSDFSPNILIIPFHGKICPKNFAIARFYNYQSFCMRLTFFSENIVIESILCCWKYFYKFL